MLRYILVNLFILQQVLIHLVPLLTIICSFPCLYQVKHVISVLRHSGPYKEDVMKEFAPQQDDGNVEQKGTCSYAYDHNTCTVVVLFFGVQLLAT